MRTLSKALLLALIMTLYVAGITFGRPRPEFAPSLAARAWLNPESVYHPDEFMYVGKPFRMLLTGEWDPHYYHNPSLNIYTNMGLFWLGHVQTYPYDLAFNDREIAPFQLNVMARYGSALFTLLTIALMYQTGRVSFGCGAGLVAAGIVAFSPLVVEHAHFATPNAETTMLGTAALLLALMILNDRVPARIPEGVFYAIAGLLVGLTAVARYNVAVVGSVTALGFAVAWYRDRRRWRAVLVGFMMMPVGAVVGMPALVLVPGNVYREVRGILDWYRVRGGGPGFTAGYGLPSILIHWRYLVLGGVGVFAALGALGGLALALRRGDAVRRQGTLNAAALVLYMLAYTGLALRGTRLQANLLFPLIIPLALLAGALIARLRAMFPARQRVITAGVILMLLWPLALSLALVYRIATPDNRIAAQAWIEEHVPRGSRVFLLGPYNVPLDPMHYTVTQTYAREARPEGVRESDAQIIVYSDASPHVILRNEALSAQRYVDREKGIRDVLAAEWTVLVEFERMPWVLEDISPDDISYWFQAGITIYCNPDDCPVSAGSGDG